MNADILASVAGVLGGHVGRAHAIHKDALASEVGIPERAVQKAVGELIQKHDLFIGSHPSLGYWMIEDEEELKLAERNLTGRGIKIFRRLAKLRKISMRELFGQMSLEFDGD